jgi:hypothetical protein
VARRRIILLVLVAVGFAIGAGTLTGRWLRGVKPPTPEPADTGLHIDPSRLDFGEVWATERFDWKLPVRNTADSDATLETLTGDCSCLSVEGLPLRVGGGETGSLTLRLDLTRRCMGVGPEPFAPIPYPIKLRGTVRVGETTHEVGWELTGRVKPAILLGRRGIDFGRLWNPTLPLERSVMVRTAPGVSIGSVEVEDSPKITASLRPAAGAGEYELTVRLDSWAPPGRYQAAVRLVPVARAGGSPGAVRLPVEWESLHEVQPDTSILEFGAHPLGSACEQTLTLTSLAGKPFRVTRCETASGSGMQADTPPPEPAASVTVRVRQRVDRPGDQVGELTISGVTAAGEPFAMKCRTHYFGVSPAGQ